MGRQSILRSLALACVALALSFASIPTLAGTQGSVAGNAVPAERLILKYQDGELEVLSRFPVTKTLPPSFELPSGHESFRGFWYEVRSPDGKVHYRKVISDPIRLVYETLDPNGMGVARLERVEAMPSERIFSVLVPRGEVGDSVHFFGRPASSIPGAASQELLSVAVSPK